MTMKDSSSKKLQMADIARLAGVSVSTVSRALNGNARINPQTVQRVQELARSLNYSINVGAKNLRMRENRTIALIIPIDRASNQSISDPFFIAMLGSLADALTEANYEILLSRLDTDQLDRIGELYDNGRACGIVVIGQWACHEQLNSLASRGVPLVVWGTQLARQMYCTVGSDNISGARMATALLLAKGCRKIAFLGDASLPEAAHRLQGFEQAHREASLTCDASLVLPVSFSGQKAHATIQAFVTRQPHIDGIVAASDLIAMAAVSALQTHGLRVPQDVRVVGYDDVDASSHFNPPISTVHQSIEDAGPVMVQVLQQLMLGNVQNSVFMPTRLVQRQSTD